jgi:hypothetical protein
MAVVEEIPDDASGSGDGVARGAQRRRERSSAVIGFLRSRPAVFDVDLGMRIARAASEDVDHFESLETSAMR